jgi:hypothetical protein
MADQGTGESGGVRASDGSFIYAKTVAGQNAFEIGGDYHHHAAPVDDPWLIAIRSCVDEFMQSVPGASKLWVRLENTTVFDTEELPEEFLEQCSTNPSVVELMLKEPDLLRTTLTLRTDISGLLEKLEVVAPRAGKTLQPEIIRAKTEPFFVKQENTHMKNPAKFADLELSTLTLVVVAIFTVVAVLITVGLAFIAIGMFMLFWRLSRKKRQKEAQLENQVRVNAMRLRSFEQIRASSPQLASVIFFAT